MISPDTPAGAAPPRITLRLPEAAPDPRWTVLRVMPGSLQSSFFHRLDPGMRVLCRVQEGQEIGVIGFDGKRLLMMQGGQRYLLEGPSPQTVIQKSRATVGLSYPRLRVKLTPLPRLAQAFQVGGAWPADLPGGLFGRPPAWSDRPTARATPPVLVVIKRRRTWVASPPGPVSVAA